MAATHADREAAPRRLAFLLLALFILLAPALPQLFGATGLFLRPWVMFSGVGVGLLKGEFVVTGPDGVEARLAPHEALGQARYSRAMATRFGYHVLSDEDLKRVSAGLCARIGAGRRLSFDGHRQWLDGWRPLADDDICGGR